MALRDIRDWLVGEMLHLLDGSRSLPRVIITLALLPFTALSTTFQVSLCLCHRTNFDIPPDCEDCRLKTHPSTGSGFILESFVENGFVLQQALWLLTSDA